MATHYPSRHPHFIVCRDRGAKCVAGGLGTWSPITSSIPATSRAAVTRRRSQVNPAPVEDGSLSHYLPGKFTSQVVFLRNFWAISLTSFIHCFPTWDIKTNPMKTPKLMKLDFVVAVWTRWSCYPVFFRKTICCIFAVNVMNRTISNKRFKTCNQFCTSF